VQRFPIVVLGFVATAACSSTSTEPSAGGSVGARCAGTPQGLKVEPHLPADWKEASVTREFRGATFHVRYERVSSQDHTALILDGTALAESVIQNIQPNRSYSLHVKIP
jgi:cellobiose phosphorylase